MGYPDGLAGAQIPLAARVFAVADVLDALTTDRPYRAGFPLRQARAMIMEESGSHFDPEVIDAFRRIDDMTFVQIGRDA
jgi:ribonuclease P protein subunit RPR2